MVAQCERSAALTRAIGLEAFLPFALWYHRGLYRQTSADFWYWKNSANYALDGEVGECFVRRE